MTGVLIRGNLDTQRDTCTQRDDCVNAQGDYCHLQAKKRGFRRNQPFQHLDLRLLAYRTVRKWMCFLTTLSVVFCYGSPSKLNMKLYCSTELHRKDTLPMRFTRKCSLFHPNSAFLSQSTSFSRYSVHSSGRLNTTFQRCPCPNARASKYISLYDKGALQM